METKDRHIIPDKFAWIIWFAIVACLVLVKWPYLDLPYYWDELGVYANGALEMARNRISLMPNALDPEISRGHPLLAYVVFAIPYKLFGTTPFVGHVTALLVSIATLAVVMALGKRFYSATVGLLATLFLAVQPLFLAQSGLVLPEMLLGLFCMLALFAYAANRHVLFALFASMALLTKETAIILPVVVLSVELIKAGLNNSIKGLLSYRWLFWLVPFLVYGAFLLIQKEQNGWYFFGLHTDSIDTSIGKLLKRFTSYVHFVFWQQGRYWVPFFVLAAALLWFMKAKGVGFVKRLKATPTATWTISVFVIGMISFSALNFFMDRYMLPTLIASAIWVGLAVEYLLRVKPKLLFIVPLILVLNAWFFIDPDRFTYDIDLGYAKQVRLMQEGISWMEDEVPKDAMVMPNFPPMYALEKNHLGYLSGEAYNNFEFNTDKLMATSNSYVVIMSPGAPIHNMHILETLKLIKLLERDGASFKVYKNEL